MGFPLTGSAAVFRMATTTTTPRPQIPLSNNSQNVPVGFPPVLRRSARFPGQSAEYRLKRYLWRSFLTITGPLVVLAFYTFICFRFLQFPLSNNIFRPTTVGATWVYYGWFLTSVFTLEWARTGLANIEASSLMIPRMAPLTARELMWHADNNWANPLWWLRALRSSFWVLLIHIRHRSHASISMPGVLWVFLSLAHILIFVAIPLSGLSFEVGDGFAYSIEPARVYGPNASTFNGRRFINFSRMIRRNLETGRQTSPSSGGLFYAPHGTEKVSMTYFDDQAVEAARNADGANIQVFAGPEVREPVWGTPWGISANISCIPTRVDQLQMIRHNGHNSSVRICSTVGGCKLEWRDTLEVSKVNAKNTELDLPVWFNESGNLGLLHAVQYYFLLAAADGWTETRTGGYPDTSSHPYNRLSNHDDLTFDHVIKGSSPEDVTNAMLEVILWQARPIVEPDNPSAEIFENYWTNNSPVVSTHNGSSKSFDELHFIGPSEYVGFGVHCDIQSAVGSARVDPDQRTFSNFERGKAYHGPGPYGANSSAGSLQTQALAAMAGTVFLSGIWGPLEPQEATIIDSTVVAVHRAIGSDEWSAWSQGKSGGLPYPPLTTENLTLGLYKLLGESVIALMSNGGGPPFASSDIYKLAPAKYLRSGVVPWQFVLCLLALWAISTSIAALYAVSFGGRRWAPTLSGFELFKFGAQYRDEIHQFQNLEFEQCSEPLKAIPGMIGVLQGGTATNTPNLTFIGLSKNVAHQRGGARRILDRQKAARAQPT